MQRTSHDWKEADLIAAEIPQQPLMELPCFEPELWRRVQASTNLRSARGILRIHRGRNTGFSYMDTHAFISSLWTYWIYLMLAWVLAVCICNNAP